MIQRMLDSGYFNNNFKVSNDKVENTIKQILYLLNKDEINSFVAEIIISLNKDKPKNPSEGLEALRKNYLWNSFKILGDNLNALKSEEDISIFYNKYKKLMPDTKLTPNKLIKKLQFKLEKSIKQIIKQVSKNLVDGYEIKEYLIR